MEPARTDPARTLTSVPSQHSPLAAVRLRRRLTVEEAAKRAGITVDEATWLEEGRIYRFRSTDDALLACLVYATALDLDRREARELAGLPVPPKPLDVNPLARLIAVAALAALLSALAVAVTFSHFHLGSSSTVARQTKRGPVLPAPWTIKVDVLNGSGDINYTRRIASRVGSYGYRIEHVTRANRFDYPETAVYFEPGGAKLAERLATQLGGVPTRPLPGGSNPRRLVVIAGPEHATS